MSSVSIPLEKIVAGSIFSAMTPAERDQLLNKYVEDMLSEKVDDYGRPDPKGKTKLEAMIADEINWVAKGIIKQLLKERSDDLRKAIEKQVVLSMPKITQSVFDRAVEKITKFG